MNSQRVNPRSAISVRLDRGQTLEAVDVDGGQVADVVAFAADDADDWLSSGRTFDYARKLFLSTGDVLWSQRSRRMLEIVADSVGRHDFLFAPCSREMFAMQYGDEEPGPNCLDNLAAALDVGVSRIPTPFNVFMHVAIGTSGALSIEPPRSRAGDSISFRAEMDLVVAVAACSAPQCNGHTFGPIDVCIT